MIYSSVDQCHYCRTFYDRKLKFLGEIHNKFQSFNKPCYFLQMLHEYQERQAVIAILSQLNIYSKLELVGRLKATN